MKSLTFHHSLLSDRIRTEGYQRAIVKVIKPGDTVLDVGSGTGILAYLACRAGAKKVYAVEVREEVVNMARRVCARNGFQDRIVFINKFSPRVRLPERVDHIVTETMGNFGLDEGILASMMDARKRLLKKGGSIIPRSIKLWIVPVECPKIYRKIDFWKSNLYGVDFSPVYTLATHHLYVEELHRGNFLSEPASLGKIKLLEVDNPRFSGEVTLTVKRRGVLHGLGGWFSAELCSGVFLSNQPPNRAKSWKNIFLPIEHPVPVERGDRLRIKIYSLGFMKENYVPAWEVSCVRQHKHFAHSTIFGFL